MSASPTPQGAGPSRSCAQAGEGLFAFGAKCQGDFSNTPRWSLSSRLLQHFVPPSTKTRSPSITTPCCGECLSVLACGSPPHEQNPGLVPPWAKRGAQEMPVAPVWPLPQSWPCPEAWSPEPCVPVGRRTQKGPPPLDSGCFSQSQRRVRQRTQHSSP